MLGAVVFIVIVYAVACGSFTAAVARSKNIAVLARESGIDTVEAASYVGFEFARFLGGFLFGPIALLAAGFYMHRPRPADMQRIRQRVESLERYRMEPQSDAPCLACGQQGGGNCTHCSGRTVR